MSFPPKMKRDDPTHDMLDNGLMAFHVIVVDALLTLLWVYFVKSHTPRWWVQGSRRHYCVRCLSPSNRMSVGLLIAASKLHVVYLVYGSSNLIFWASATNSLCIFVLMVEAVAFNSGPFKVLRGGSNSIAKGVLPPLRTRTGTILSIGRLLRWAFYGGHDQTSAMTAFVINPHSSNTLVDHDDDDGVDGSFSGNIFLNKQDRHGRGNGFKVLGTNRVSPGAAPEIQSGARHKQGKILPALLGSTQSGSVVLRYGPCNCFRTNLSVMQWNNLMLDSSLPSMVKWLKENSIRTQDTCGSRRGRALMCMRNDGALRSIMLQSPDARTIFDLCGTWTSQTAYVVSSVPTNTRSQDCKNRVQTTMNFSGHTMQMQGGRAHIVRSGVDSFEKKSAEMATSPPPSPPVSVMKAEMPPEFDLNEKTNKLNSGRLVVPAKEGESELGRISSTPTIQAGQPQPLSLNRSLCGARQCLDTRKASVFEIVMKTYPGDKTNYWYYADYSEWGLVPTASQSIALGRIMNHLNNSSNMLDLRCVRCKNAFVSGDYQRIVTLRHKIKRSERSSDYWLHLRS